MPLVNVRRATTIDAIVAAFPVIGRASSTPAMSLTSKV
jgi:hypothetical protein